MPTVSPTLPNDGDDAIVGPYNTAILAILSVFNGSIDQDNIAAGGITTSRLADLAVTNAKIADQTLILENKVASNSGWAKIADTHTYSSWDSTNKTGVVTIPTDGTTKYSVGMRYSISQATGGTKYFIITKIAATAMTIFGGTDYTLNNETVSSPRYSPSKAPFGFPTNPAKWTVTTTDTTDRTQSSPTAGTWYNLGSVSISIPLGDWNVAYQVNAYQNNGANENDTRVTLSTANNSESDNTLTSRIGGSALTILNAHVRHHKFLTLAAATVYYLNTKAIGASATNIANYNGSTNGSPLLIEAVCAHL